MAAGDSDVSICNIALIAIGEDPVSSVFPAENTKRAIICNARYHDVRRAVLRAHPWNCAKKRVSLAASTTAPAFGPARQFPLPSDFLRFLTVDESLDGAAWDIEDGFILTDESDPLPVHYIYDLQDATRFDPLLVHAIAYALAVEIAEPLGQDVAKARNALAQLTDKVATARLVGSQENSPREWDEDIMLRSRS